MLYSWCCCEVWAPRKASMAMLGPSSHTGVSTSIKSRQRHTHQGFGSASTPWQNSSKCFPLEECLLPQLQAGIQIGSCFVFYPSSCLTERKHEEKEKLLVYNSIQEIFRKEDDWKIQIRTFSDKLKGKKKGSTHKQKNNQTSEAMGRLLSWQPMHPNPVLWESRDYNSKEEPHPCILNRPSASPSY